MSNIDVAKAWKQIPAQLVYLGQSYKALDINEELSKTCRKPKLDFITHKNIKPRIDLHKSRLHLNRNNSGEIGKNFIDLILKYLQMSA